MPKEKTSVKKALASVNASMAVEGLKPSRKTMALGKQFLEGKVSIQEAVDRVKAQHLTKKHYEK
jgi:hypothetical protein